MSGNTSDDTPHRDGNNNERQPTSLRGGYGSGGGGNAKPRPPHLPGLTFDKTNEAPNLSLDRLENFSY